MKPAFVVLALAVGAYAAYRHAWYSGPYVLDRCESGRKLPLDAHPLQRRHCKLRLLGAQHRGILHAADRALGRVQRMIQRDRLQFNALGEHAGQFATKGGVEGRSSATGRGP